MSPDAFLVRLQCEQERGNSDGDGVDQCELDRFKRVGGGQEQEADRNHAGEYGFDQKERGGALQIVDRAPSLPHNVRHAGKIGIEQHQVGNGAGRFAACCHRDAAIAFPQGHHIVGAVSCHGDSMSAILQCLDQDAFLIRSDAAKHGVVLRRLPQLLRGQGGSVKKAIRAWQARFPGDAGRRRRVVTGNDFECHPLF